MIPDESKQASDEAKVPEQPLPPSLPTWAYGEPCLDHGYHGCRCWEDDLIKFPG
jgi:hypothetical protein